MAKLFDVQVWKFPGVDTDTVTGSRRYAIERAETINSQNNPYHRRAIVVDNDGRPVWR